MDENTVLFNVIDKQIRVLVGTLCKRIEVLEKNNALTPNLYKEISKELLYEWSRGLKTIIEIGKIEFIPKKQNKSV